MAATAVIASSKVIASGSKCLWELFAAEPDKLTLFMSSLPFCPVRHLAFSPHLLFLLNTAIATFRTCVLKSKAHTNLHSGAWPMVSPLMLLRHLPKGSTFSLKQQQQNKTIFPSLLNFFPSFPHLSPLPSFFSLCFMIFSPALHFILIRSLWGGSQCVTDQTSFPVRVEIWVLEKITGCLLRVAYQWDNLA